MMQTVRQKRNVSTVREFEINVISLSGNIAYQWAVELSGRFLSGEHLHRNDILSENFLEDWSSKMKTVQVFLLFIAAETSCMMIYLHEFTIFDIARPA